jgi:isocitrate dehydrogenase
VDLFVHWRGSNPEELAQILHAMDGDALQLKLITNRGIRVYPGGFPETFCTDHWRCRFVNKEGAEVAKAEVISLLQKAESAGLDFIKTEHLYTFGGVKTFSLGQGE